MCRPPPHIFPLCVSTEAWACLQCWQELCPSLLSRSTSNSCTRRWSTGRSAASPVTSAKVPIRVTETKLLSLPYLNRMQSFENLINQNFIHNRTEKNGTGLCLPLVSTPSSFNYINVWELRRAAVGLSGEESCLIHDWNRIVGSEQSWVFFAIF